MFSSIGDSTTETVSNQLQPDRAMSLDTNALPHGIFGVVRRRSSMAVPDQDGGRSGGFDDATIDDGTPGVPIQTVSASCDRKPGSGDGPVLELATAHRPDVDPSTDIGVGQRFLEIGGQGRVVRVAAVIRPRSGIPHARLRRDGGGADVVLLSCQALADRCAFTPLTGSRDLTADTLAGCVRSGARPWVPGLLIEAQLDPQLTLRRAAVDAPDRLDDGN